MHKFTSEEMDRIMYLSVAALEMAVALLAISCHVQRYLNRSLAIITRGSVPIPDDMCWRGVKGCFVGVCVATGDKKPFGQGYAHAHVSDRWAGWMCFSKLSYLEVVGVRHHELAHILAGDGGHDDNWRAYMTTLGQRIPRAYKSSRCK